MQAIVLEEPKHFKSVQIEEPTAPGPSEALVRVHRVGICGTDISGYLGKFPFYSYPRIPGHELGVEILAVGPDVTNVRPREQLLGRTVHQLPDMLFLPARKPNCCQQLRVLGVHTDGGMRSRFIVPARKLHPSKKLTLEQLALVETLAIGCHAVNRAAPLVDEHVLVIGAGPIGLSVIEFVRLIGCRLTVLDLNARRLEFCKRTGGIRDTVLAKGDASDLKSLEDLDGGQLPTVVIDATGSPRSMSGAFQYVGHTGRLIFVGIVTSDITFPDPLLHSREMTLLASRNAVADDFRRIIGLIEAGRIDTRPWITHHSTMATLADDFPAYTKPETGVVKAIVEVNDS